MGKINVLDILIKQMRVSVVASICIFFFAFFIKKQISVIIVSSEYECEKKLKSNSTGRVHWIQKIISYDIPTKLWIHLPWALWFPQNISSCSNLLLKTKQKTKKNQLPTYMYFILKRDIMNRHDISDGFFLKRTTYLFKSTDSYMYEIHVHQCIIK